MDIFHRQATVRISSTHLLRGGSANQAQIAIDPFTAVTPGLSGLWVD